MNRPEQLIAQFYQALSRRDFETVARCYHAEATYFDPVFGELNRDDLLAMLRMILSRDVAVVYGDVQAHGDEVSGHWEANYKFSKTGRLVHNVIDSRFWSQNGLIVRQVESFDKRTWARQAFGPAGNILSILPPFWWAIRRAARRSIRDYLRS